MIVIDIETSGNFDQNKNGIWQIGAIELENPSNTFLEEAHIDDSDDVEEGALKVTGKTEEELRDKTKQTQRQLLENFFAWVSKINDRLFIAHNTPFDYGFIYLKAKKYGLKVPFSHRTFDLHAIAAVKYYELHGEYLMENGSHKMNLSNVLKMCGLPDPRIRLDGTQVVQEGDPHNGLYDAKLEAECFSRIVYGKPLLPEFNKFEMPSNLKK